MAQVGGVSATSVRGARGESMLSPGTGGGCCASRGTERPELRLDRGRDDVMGLLRSLGSGDLSACGPRAPQQLGWLLCPRGRHDGGRLLPCPWACASVNAAYSVVSGRAALAFDAEPASSACR